MHFLVRKMKLDLQNELIHALYKEDRLEALLQEHPGVAAQRARAQEQVLVLSRAQSIIDEAGVWDLGEEGLNVRIPPRPVISPPPPRASIVPPGQAKNPAATVIPFQPR